MLEVFTPEITAIIVVAVLILVAVFFAIVSNRISSMDSRFTHLTEDIHRHVESNILTLANQMHEDIVNRGKKMEESLGQMGDSWRSTLEKTTTDVRGEIGKLKSEVNNSTISLNNSLMDIITSNAVDFNEQLAQARDVHHKDIQQYHQQLTEQVRQHAQGEHAVLTAALDDISETMKKNIGDLAQNQSQVLEKVSTSAGEGYQALAEKVEQDIERTTEKAEHSLDSMSQNLDTSIGGIKAKFQKEIEETSKSVTEKMGDMSSSVNQNLGEITTHINKELDSISSTLESDLKDTTSKLDRNLEDVTSKLSSNIEVVTDRVDDNMRDIGKQIDSGISSMTSSMEDKMGNIKGDVSKNFDSLSKDVEQNFDNIGKQIDERFSEDMDKLQKMLELFKSLASKIELIDSTRSHIEQLSDNVGVLAQVLDDRRSRGALGEVLVESIVSDALAPSDYTLNATLSNGEKVECLLKLPQPSGNVAISTRIDMSSMETIASPIASDSDRQKAKKMFHAMLLEAVVETSHNCIIENETAEGAILLLPSESAFSEAHVNCRDVVDEAYKRNVWIASPSTLIAMVTVARAVIKDAFARRKMDEVRSELVKIEEDYGDLEKNFQSLTRNVDDLLSDATETRKAARRIGDRFNHVQSIFARPPQSNIADQSSDSSDSEH